MNINRPCDPRIHGAAIRLARECRRIVQACLREEEFAEADREFYRVIRAGLEDFGVRGDAPTSGSR